jgi:hypothetical protein
MKFLSHGFYPTWFRQELDNWILPKAISNTYSTSSRISKWKVIPCTGQQSRHNFILFSNRNRFNVYFLVMARKQQACSNSSCTVKLWSMTCMLSCMQRRINHISYSGSIVDWIWCHGQQRRIMSCTIAHRLNKILCLGPQGHSVESDLKLWPEPQFSEQFSGTRFNDTCSMKSNQIWHRGQKCAIGYYTAGHIAQSDDDVSQRILSHIRNCSICRIWIRASAVHLNHELRKLDKSHVIVPFKIISTGTTCVYELCS